MINLTNNEIAFAQVGEALDKSVRGAMADAAFALLDLLGLSEDDLAAVSTKTNVSAAYARLAIECTLRKPRAVFDERFINRTFEFYKAQAGTPTEDDFYAVIRARFDLLRRELLARNGDARRAFDSSMPPNPAAECAGLLRSLVQANDLSYAEVVELLEGDGHLTRLPRAPLWLLGEVSEDE